MWTKIQLLLSPSVDFTGREFQGIWPIDVTIRVIARLNVNLSERH
jgi:hypothetical protein